MGLADDRFRARLLDVPDQNRLIVTYDGIQPVEVAESDTPLTILFLKGTDQHNRPLMIALRQEVVFMLQAACVGLCWVSPDPRSKGSHLTPTWGIHSETEDPKFAQIRKDAKERGERLIDLDDIDEMEGMPLHQPTFLEACGAPVEDGESRGTLTTMFATRNGERYAYSFGQSTMDAMAVSLIEGVALRRQGS